MGCDIHAHVERKKKSEVADLWEDRGKMYIGRSYHLFSLLAGVGNGNGVTPISEPRGLPDNVSGSFVGYSNDYGNDGHSHSHVTLKELKEYDRPERYGSRYEKYDFFAYLIDEMEKARLENQTDDDVRLVFFFDN